MNVSDLDIAQIIADYSAVPDGYTPSPVKRLWASELGNCPRKIGLRLRDTAETDPFSSATKRVMKQGVVGEAETGRALEWQFGKRLRTQVSIQGHRWSAKLDFVIGHGTAVPIIIEHKATSDMGMRYVPRQSHIQQAWLYGQLYEEAFQIKPQVVLFYRGWNKSAQVTLTEYPPDRLLVSGIVDGVSYEKWQSLTDLQAARRQAEVVYDVWQDLGEDADERVLQSTLSPRLEDKTQGCIFGKGKVACVYYGHCWGDDADE